MKIGNKSIHILSWDVLISSTGYRNINGDRAFFLSCDDGYIELGYLMVFCEPFRFEPHQLRRVKAI